VANLKRVVKHHYQAELDGHKRRYVLRHVLDINEAKNEIAKAGTLWPRAAGIGRTWLRRLGDSGSPVKSSLIPYTHFGVSLITLIRMGLSDAAKERLYGEFLQVF
jgi:hypothetical protein